MGGPPKLNSEFEFTTALVKELDEGLGDYSLRV